MSEPRADVSAIVEAAVLRYRARMAIEDAVFGSIVEASVPYAEALLIQRSTEFVVRNPEQAELLRAIREEVDRRSKETAERIHRKTSLN